MVGYLCNVQMLVCDCQLKKFKIGGMLAWEANCACESEELQVYSRYTAVLWV
jgi:hypothetical protein